MKPDIESIFPEGISDETAFALCEIVHELALAYESRYFVQLRRYRDTHLPEPFDPEQPWRTKPPAE